MVYMVMLLVSYVNQAFITMPAAGRADTFFLMKANTACGEKLGKTVRIFHLDMTMVQEYIVTNRLNVGFMIRGGVSCQRATTGWSV